MTTAQKMTKDDWYTVCEALEAWAEKLENWSANATSESMALLYRAEAGAAGELLSRLVNAKLREADKWRRFSTFVD
jgi:hypothetical protein